VHPISTVHKVGDPVSEFGVSCVGKQHLLRECNVWSVLC
jgi:hypothetical protein